MRTLICIGARTSAINCFVVLRFSCEGPVRCIARHVLLWVLQLLSRLFSGSVADRFWAINKAIIATATANLRFFPAILHLLLKSCCGISKQQLRFCNYAFMMFTSRCGKGMVMLLSFRALNTARFTSNFV